MKLKEEHEQQIKLNKEAEGRKIKEANQNYTNKIESIKQNKVQQLLSNGVDTKYYSKLI